MDGRPLFDLSQLLEYYRKEKEATEATLKKIPDKFIRVSEQVPCVYCTCVVYSPTYACMENFQWVKVVSDVMVLHSNILFPKT